MPKSCSTAAVVDVFCGVGGLSHGFHKEGFNVLAGIDVDPACEYPFETNNKARFIKKSVEDVTPEQLNNIFGETKVKVLVGCAPCQPYSTINRRKDKNDEWKLLRDFSRLVSETEPGIVSMENVTQIRHHAVFKEFVDGLEKDGYVVSQNVVFCPDYGIPQRRRRLVLLASKFGQLNLIRKTHTPDSYKTLKDSIGKLAPLEAGKVDPKDPLHRARNLTPLNMKRIESTPEGGGWKDWHESIRLKCHRKEKGRSFGAVYGRMRWDSPASTITTEFHNLGSGRFGHPVQHRAISLREAALIQTFPRYYRFFKEESEITFDGLARLIGNAVPVRLGQVIARSIRQHLEQSAINE